MRQMMRDDGLSGVRVQRRSAIRRRNENGVPARRQQPDSSSTWKFSAMAEIPIINSAQDTTWRDSANEVCLSFTCYMYYSTKPRLQANRLVTGKCGWLVRPPKQARSPRLLQSVVGGKAEEIHVGSKM